MGTLKKVVCICLVCITFTGLAQKSDTIAPKKPPIKSMGDVFHSNKFLLGKDIISGNIFYATNRSVFTDSSGNHFESLNSLGSSLKIRLFEMVSLNTTFFFHLNQKAVLPWTADYFYSLKRANWKPRTFSYGYENYAGNKYTDSSQQFFQNFLYGSYFVSFNHGLPKKWIETLRFDKTTNLMFTYAVRYNMQYRDEFFNIHKEGRVYASIGARYTIWKNVYVEGAVNIFTDKSKRLPWDPDYTYGFGYFDWRPFKLSVTYGNWVVNRFKDTPAQYAYYGILDGNLQISFNYAW